MIIQIKFAHSSPFRLLILKMQMFTLAISRLTISNLPRFMDLASQVPMQFCSLQHQTLLPSPVTSTTRHCFLVGLVSLFFLELFLHSSPVAYWAPTDLGSSSFNVLSFSSSYCLWCSQAKNTEVVVHTFCSGPRFVITLHHTHLSQVALHGRSYIFIGLHKAVIHVISLVSFL